MPTNTLLNPFFGTKGSLDDLLGEVLGRQIAPGQQVCAPARAEGYVPPVDVAETDDGYELHLELPGVDAANLEIEFENETLVVKGQKQDQRKVDENGRHLTERRYGSFSRSIKFRKPVDGERIAADLKDGVLAISLPKLEQVKRRKIAIGLGNDG